MMTAILAVFAGGAAPAMAQSGEDAPFDASNSLLSQVASVAGADIRTSDVRIKDAEEYFGRLVLASGDHVYGIDGLLLSRDDNGYRILADRMTINRTEPDSPVLAISDIEARLAPGFFWRSPADIFCAWTDSMQELRIGSISGRLPLAPAGGEVQTALGGIEWTGQGGNGCRLTGTVKVADITVGGATEAGFDITSLDLGLDIPVGQEAARAEDGRSTIRAAFGAFSLYTDRRDLIQGLNDGTVELAGTAQSALPAVLIASRFDIFDRERNDLALEMDAWNLLALMRADIRWDFRQMQTMSATVIPAEMTANFRSVGLSILSSSASGLMRMRAGQVSVSSTSDHVGLGRAEIGAAFTIAPHGREAIVIEIQGPEISTGIEYFDFHLSLSPIFFGGNLQSGTQQCRRRISMCSTSGTVS